MTLSVALRGLHPEPAVAQFQVVSLNREERHAIPAFIE